MGGREGGSVRGETDRSRAVQVNVRDVECGGVARSVGRSVSQSVFLSIDWMREGRKRGGGEGMYRCNNLVGHSKDTSVTF